MILLPHPLFITSTWYFSRRFGCLSTSTVYLSLNSVRQVLRGKCRASSQRYCLRIDMRPISSLQSDLKICMPPWAAVNNLMRFDFSSAPAFATGRLPDTVLTLHRENGKTCIDGEVKLAPLPQETSPPRPPPPYAVGRSYA